MLEEGATGLLDNPIDPQALAAVIMSLLGDPARRAQIGKCAQEGAVTQYSLDKIVAHMLAFYQQVLDANA